MKKASQILYTIGKVFNVIEIIGFALMIVAGIVALVFPEADMIEQAASWLNMGAVTATGIGMIVAGAIGLIVSAIVLYFANRATKSLYNGVNDTVPHVIMIVVGFFGVIFYMIGGIVALVAENTQSDARV